MGSLTKYNNKVTRIKMKLIVCLASLLPVLLGASVFQEKQDASIVLDGRKGRVRRTFQLSELSIDWFSNKLESVKDWQEFKEGVEKTWVPEEQTEVLEKCVTKCWWKDRGLYTLGHAFEEKREDYVDAKAQGLNPTRPVPCPECCKAIPPSLNAETWPYVQRTCANVDMNEVEDNKVEDIEE